MNILFLHGLRENFRNNPILNSLKSFTNHTILSPELNPWEPEKTLDKLKDIPADLCIGFSLGGLFASALNIPKKILINPALAFVKTLKERKFSRWDQVKYYETFTISIPNWIRSIFTTEDKKIGMKGLPIYLNYFSEDTITYLPGGHELTNEQIINNLIPLI